MVAQWNITVKRKVCEDRIGAVQCGSDLMRKEDRIGFRVPSELKKTLVQIAKTEGRSLAQVCEILLRGGVWSYKEEGSKYIQRLLSRQKKPPVD
jgi:hypothetical protein